MDNATEPLTSPTDTGTRSDPSVPRTSSTSFRPDQNARSGRRKKYSKDKRTQRILKPQRGSFLRKSGTWNGETKLGSHGNAKSSNSNITTDDAKGATVLKGSNSPPPRSRSPVRNRMGARQRARGMVTGADPRMSDKDFFSEFQMADVAPGPTETEQKKNVHPSLTPVMIARSSKSQLGSPNSIAMISAPPGSCDDDRDETSLLTTNVVVTNSVRAKDNTGTVELTRRLIQDHRGSGALESSLLQAPEKETPEKTSTVRRIRLSSLVNEKDRFLV
eukprot:1394562-Amorphochlora_amoeboformis.AAC.1